MDIVSKKGLTVKRKIVIINNKYCKCHKDVASDFPLGRSGAFYVYGGTGAFAALFILLIMEVCQYESIGEKYSCKFKAD